MDNLNKFMINDEKVKNEIKAANEANSRRISTNEAAILRKHFEDENLRLYVTKVNLDTVSAKNPYELAQGAKQAILKKG